jgi:hypothetical protein
MTLHDCDFCGTPGATDVLFEEGYPTLFMCEDQTSCLGRMDLIDPDIADEVPGMVLA